MKKIIFLLILCSGFLMSCYDDSALVERIDALEKNTIASIKEQILSIKSSITALESVDQEVKATIQALESKDASLQTEIEKLQNENTSLKDDINKLKEESTSIKEDITSLKEKDIALETQLGNLKTYVNNEMSDLEDWTSTTFATLEKHDSLCVVLVSIQTSISDLEEEMVQALVDAIAKSEESIKGWVNEQLTGYWTIAETEAKLNTLKTNHDSEITAIKEDIKATAEDLTTAYKNSIAEAIKESEGKLSTKVDDINKALEKKISDIETRLTAVEEKLSHLAREFSITFDDNEVGVFAGGTTSVGYTIIGATEKTIVKALGQNGWNAKVTPNGTDKGTITVTAPNPMSNDEIIVLVYDGEFRTIMSTINFVTGVVTPSQTAVELEAEASTIEITVTSNLNYKVSIPEDAKNWLSLVETRATKTETITFACTANEFTIRQTEISFIDDANNVFTKVSVVQQGSVTEVTLTETGSLLDAIGPDFVHKIKSLKVNGPINGTDVKIIRQMSLLKSLDLTNAQIVSGGEAYGNVNGFSLYTSNDVIGREMFYKKEIEVIYLPNEITTIGQDAFGWCRNLKEVRMGNKVTIIETNAFSVCSSLENITLSNKIKHLGNGAFSSSHIKTINLSNDLEYIGPNCFNDCYYLTSVTIPENTNTIGERAFNGCFALKEVHIKAQPQTLSNVGENLFSYFTSSGTDNSLYEKAVLYIPIGSKSYYNTTDFGRFANIVEE